MVISIRKVIVMTSKEKLYAVKRTAFTSPSFNCLSISHHSFLFYLHSSFDLNDSDDERKTTKEVLNFVRNFELET